MGCENTTKMVALPGKQTTTNSAGENVLLREVRGLEL